MNYISTSLLEKIPKGQAFDKTYSPEYYRNLKSQIAKEGIKEPLVLIYYVRDNALRLGEGHHRFNIALELDIKKVPVRVAVIWGQNYFEEDNPYHNIDVRDQPIYHPPKALDVEYYKERFYYPSEVEPSELGLTGGLLSESTISRQLRALGESLFMKELNGISSDFDLFLDRYNKGERGHDHKMAYAIKKIMLEIGFPYIKLFQNFINISDELKENGLIVGDLDNPQNWGFKDGHLAVFDIGFGKDWSDLKDLATISEVDKSQEPFMMYDKIRKLAKKMGVEVIKYLGGQNYGYAYEVSGGKVLKLTTDQTEARNCLKIVNKQMEYIADVYKVYKYLLEERYYYLILLEKLDTNNIQPVIEKYNEIDDFIFNLWAFIDKKKQ